MSWTEEKVQKLRELWGKDNTASEIAQILGGVSRNAVIGKAHRLNLSSKIKTRSNPQISKNNSMIWNHTDASELKMKKFSENDLKEYLDKISTKTLLAYGVYQIEAKGLELFEYIKGDRDSIMGLPIKDIINYIKQYYK